MIVLLVLMGLIGILLFALLLVLFFSVVLDALVSWDIFGEMGDNWQTLKKRWSDRKDQEDHTTDEE